MGSSRPVDRSIGEATFLPQWMKGKMDTRFDYSDTTFSPPADDDFFFIHYTKHKEALKSSSINNNNNKEGFRPINEILGNKSESSGSGLQDLNKAVDLNKHTLPFKSFIPFISDKANEPKIVIANNTQQQSSNNESRNTSSTESGRSIVSVASQIMSSKFGKANSSDSSSTVQNQSNEISQQRKGSKSLPATPLASPSNTPEGSPKTRRRVYGNRYFTGAFVSDSERPRNGWLLSSILGQSRDLITPKIEEEEEQIIDQVPTRALSRKKSISSQNLTYLGKDDNNSNNNNKIQQNILQVNPSELREMNFWSPTSM